MRSSQTIAYEECPLRGGLTFERAHDDRLLRVLVPAPRDWRHLPRAAAVAIVLMAALALLFIAAALRNWHTDARDALFLNGGLFAVVLALIVLVAHQRLYRTMVFELGGGALTLTTIASDGGGRSMRTWPRDEIADVTVSAATGYLVLRLRGGQEPLEFFVGPRDTARQIASALHHALAALPAADPPAAIPLESVAGLDALPTRRLRKLLWWGFGLLVAVAALFLMTGHACGAAYVLMLAAAPAGLALGTGEKDVYL